MLFYTQYMSLVCGQIIQLRCSARWISIMWKLGAYTFRIWKDNGTLSEMNHSDTENLVNILVLGWGSVEGFALLLI